MGRSYGIFTIFLLIKFNEAAAECKSELGLDLRLPSNRRLSDDKIKASSSKTYYYPKYGRLNNKYNSSAKNLGAWCALATDKNPWLQVDFGKMVTINAVATQPSTILQRWVEYFSLSYSYDGTLWHEHRYKDSGQRIEGNKNGYDTVKRTVNPPVTARFIRFHPLTWHREACARVEFYGCLPGNNCQTPVGVSASLMKIPDENMKASSRFFQHYAHEGRLNNTYRKGSGGERNWGAWCASKSDTDPYLQIDLGRVRVISGVATQGYIYNLWTTEYRLNFSIDSVNWKQYKEDETVRLFTANADSKSMRLNMLKKAMSARYVRFNPTKWNGQSKNMPCLRVEVFECLPIKGSVPTISPTLTDRSVKRGTTFNLTCGVQGQPGAQIAWKRDGFLFSTTDRISIVSQVFNGIRYSSLEFKSVKMEQNGKIFSCVAWYPSTDVQAISAATLSVLGAKPMLEIRNVSRNDVIFFLSAVGKVTEGIRSYKVTLDTVPWSREARRTSLFPFNTKVPIFNFSGLKPYNKYKILVSFIYTNDDEGTNIPGSVFRTLEDVPSGPPENLQILSVTQNSARLSWQPPDLNHRRGQITNYHVLVKRTYQDGSAKENEILFNTTEPYYIVKNLEQNTRYVASVRALTSIGFGPYTNPRDILTLRADTVIEKPTSSSKSSVTDELVKIKKEKVNKENAVSVTRRLENITAVAKNLEAVDVKLTADILEKVIKVNDSSKEVGEAIVETVSNILDANTSVLEKSQQENNTGSRYVKIIETWLEKVDTTDGDVSKETKNIIVKKMKITKEKVHKKINFKGKGGTSVVVPAGTIITEKDKSQGAKEEGKNQTILFVSYKNANFFRPVSKVRLRESCEDGYTVDQRERFSAVISSSIPGMVVKNLSEPIVLTFRRPGRKKNEDIGAIHCSFWKTDEYRWSTKGCKLHSIVNDTIECHCDHMTNFAAMMDVYGHTSKACGMHGQLLSLISIVGCFLSLVGLFLTMLTYSMFRRLRKELAAQVLIQLCFALFVLIIVFLTGVERTNDQRICLAVAILLHYFSLVAFMWMLMEAILMFQAFVMVWPTHEDNDIIKCSLAAWGIPGLVVSATLVFGLDNYGSKHYCRISALPFYIAFLGPVCLILAVNIILFILIMYKLSTRITSTVDRSNANANMIRLKRAFGILILVGLTWSLGAMAISDARLIFQYLFSICNSLQGFSIFLFYCISQKNVRDSWIALFKCDLRSELKMRTDSYYERRRLSSASKTNNGTLLTRTRTNSSSMAPRQEGEKNNGVDEEGGHMQTIVEIDITSDSGHPVPPGDFVCDGHLGPYENRASAASSAEDELLKIRQHVPLEPYRSYRALSGARSYDMLEMSDLNKKKYSSKSNEALIRKSMILGQSSPLVLPKQKVRPVKSCDHLVKTHIKDVAPLIDFDSSWMMNQPQSDTIKKKAGIRKDSNTSSLTDLSSHSSDTLKAKGSSKVETLGASLGTLIDRKPRSISASAMMEHALLFKDPSRVNQMNDRLGRSQDDIIKWLHDTESVDDIVDSDEDCKSSQSQSDITERSTSVSSSSTCAKAEKERRKNEKKILDKLVVAPIRGVSASDSETAFTSGDETIQNGKINNNYTSSLPRSDVNSSTLYDSSDSDRNSAILSDEGYSASGEDMLEGSRPRKFSKRQRRRSRSRKGARKRTDQCSSYV